MSDIVERLRTHCIDLEGGIRDEEILAAAGEITRLRSLLKEAGEWRDISTAPKDGTEIIIAGDDWSSCASWGETKYHGSGWLDACDIAHKDSYTARPLSGVTHWLPLPLPPSEDECK